MSFEPQHIPVMRDEIVAAMLGAAPARRRGRQGPASALRQDRPLRLVDLTLGLGGHATALLEAAPAGSELLGLDRDLDALAIAGNRLAGFGARFQSAHACFSELPAEMKRIGWTRVDGVFADLGVSSLQLDAGERGFSFRHEAALDMRMDQSRGETAAELLERVDEVELTRILRELGEEPAARRIARAVCTAHPKPATTEELRSLVGRVAGGPRHRRRRIDPATLTFQALRIAVNRELLELKTLLAGLPDVLAAGARVVFLAYHSLEDRRVKNAFRNWLRACVCPPELLICRCGGVPRAQAVIRGAAKPGDDEIAANPRARSARLRAIAWGGSHGR
jgi:16S rRNA (cytosine1402-N4)-methyltransferase